MKKRRRSVGNHSATGKPGLYEGTGDIDQKPSSTALVQTSTLQASAPTTSTKSFETSAENFPTSNLTHREFISQRETLSNIEMRQNAVKFLFWAYGGLLLCTMTVIFFQGFKVYGFALEQQFLNWLGAATIGEVAGLAYLVYGALFRKK